MTLEGTEWHRRGQSGTGGDTVALQGTDRVAPEGTEGSHPWCQFQAVTFPVPGVGVTFPVPGGSGDIPGARGWRWHWGPAGTLTPQRSAPSLAGVAV